MKTSNRAFLTRTAARSFRATINEKAPAKLRDAVKGEDGLWTFPGLNHGSKLSLKRN